MSLSSGTMRYGSEACVGRQDHESRVEFLDALAVLMGCEGALGGELPDGRRPDVLRFDQGRRVLFVGDAKHSESPGNRETQARLHRYLKWMSSHVGSGGDGIFAVCFGRESDTDAWVETLVMLTHEVGLVRAEGGVERFEQELTVAWYTFGTLAVARASPISTS